MSEGPIIYVDADACPVKDEVKKVAERHSVIVTIVSNGGMRPSRDPMVRNVIVPKSADAADDWIVEQVKENDIVITSDVLLAARCVELNAEVMGPTGRAFSDSSIGMQVAMRDLKQQLRESGDIKGHNPSFSAKDRSNFLQALEAAIRKVKPAS